MKATRSSSALRAHRTRQLAERLATGGNYQDQDLVVCQVDGTPIHPKTISYQFGKAARAAHLPAIRLHDLRHTHATLALSAGIHPRIVQERLGHANVSITLDTYSHVDLDMQAVAARQVAALVTGLSPGAPCIPVTTLCPLGPETTAGDAPTRLSPEETSPAPGGGGGI